MYKFLLFSFLILLPCQIFPQKKEKDKKSGEHQKVYIDASAGASFPLGNYSKVDKNNKKAGYTKTGYFIHVNADWMGKKDFGLAFQYCFQHNPFKDTAQNIILYGSLYPMGGKGWSNHYLFAGPVMVKTVKKISIDARFLAGVIISVSPVFNNVDPVSKENVTNTATGFAFQFGVGIGYQVTSRLAIKLTLNYTEGYPMVDKKYTTSSIDTTLSYNLLQVEIKKTVSTFNCGAGIIYRF